MPANAVWNTQQLKGIQTITKEHFWHPNTCFSQVPSLFPGLSICSGHTYKKNHYVKTVIWKVFHGTQLYNWRDASHMFTRGLWTLPSASCCQFLRRGLVMFQCKNQGAFVTTERTWGYIFLSCILPSLLQGVVLSGSTLLRVTWLMTQYAYVGWGPAVHPAMLRNRVAC